MGSPRMQKPVFERLQNAKHYSVYKKRSLNRNKTDPNTFLSVNDDHTKIDNFFEPPLTKREWWRVVLKETPVPGTYEYTDFLQSSNKRPLYASFKAEPRDKKNLSNSCGEKLLPGAYEYIDFIESLRQKPCTFSFKSSGRKAQLAWERLGTEENRFPVPGQYETTCPPITKMTVYSSAFRSKTERFKDLFSAKSGPPPGRYDPTNFTLVGMEKKSIKSSFVSKAPRFKASGTNVPGPGTYETDRYDRYLGISIGKKRLL